jgi:hypothetical protein
VHELLIHWWVHAEYPAVNLSAQTSPDTRRIHLLLFYASEAVSLASIVIDLYTHYLVHCVSDVIMFSLLKGSISLKNPSTIKGGKKITLVPLHKGVIITLVPNKRGSLWNSGTSIQCRCPQNLGREETPICERFPLAAREIEHPLSTVSAWWWTKLFTARTVLGNLGSCTGWLWSSNDPGPLYPLNQIKNV